MQRPERRGPPPRDREATLRRAHRRKNRQRTLLVVLIFGSLGGAAAFVQFARDDSGDPRATTQAGDTTAPATRDGQPTETVAQTTQATTQPEPEEPQPEAEAEAVGTARGGEAKPVAPRQPLAGRIVVLDPGHNPGNSSHPESSAPVAYGEGTKPCDTSGTSTNDGYPEYAFTWDVSRRVMALLQRRGAKVVLTRTGSRPAWGPCITERAAIGNRARADAAVSIHADGGQAGNPGFFTIVTASPIPSVGKSQAMIDADVALATSVRDAYRSATGLRVSGSYGSTGIYRSNDYGGTNLSKVPKIFIECGNMRDAGDAAKLRSAGFRQRAALGIANGIERFIRASRGAAS